MKNRIFLIILLFIGAVSVAGAATKLDTLLNNERIAKNDTAKYSANVKLGAFYFGRDAKVAQKYMWEALRYAKRLKDKNRISISYINISTLYSLRNKFKQAVDTLNIGIRMAEEAGCREEIAFGYSQLGTVYKRLGDYEKSIGAFNKAVAIVNRSSVEDSLRIYRKKGKKLDIYQDTYLNSVAIIYNDMALAYLMMKDTTEAISVLKFSLKVAEASMRLERIGAGYANLGEIYSGMGKYGVAEEYLKKAISYFKQVGNFRFEIITKDYLANMYIEKKDFAKAQKIVEETSRTEVYKLGEYSGFCCTAAKLYSGLKNYSQALHYMKIAEENIGSSIQNKLEVWRCYTDIYKKIGNYAKALECIEKYNAVKDSLYSSEQYSVLADKLAFYQVAKKDDEIRMMKTKLSLTEMQEQQENTLRWLFITVIGALMFIVCFLIMMNRARRRNETQISEKNAELEAANIQLTETNATKDKFFSIIAHDLRNPISSFRNVVELMHDDYDNIKENERREFLGMLKQSSEQVFALLENLLEWSRAQHKTIKFNPTEIDISSIAQTCVDLLSLTAEKKGIRLKNSIPKSKFIYADAKLITTIIRNLMSNSVKFTREGGEIEAGFCEHENGDVELYVRDSGVGMDAKRVANLFHIDKSISTHGTNGEAGTGLGLILCKEFVDMHGGKIWVESEVGIGSKFIFTLPQPKASNEGESE